MEAFASIEKNSIFSFDSISTLCSFQCARARFRFALVPFARNFYSITLFYWLVNNFLQILDSHFSLYFTVVSDSFYIIPKTVPIVNTLFSSFFVFLLFSLRSWRSFVRFFANIAQRAADGPQKRPPPMIKQAGITKREIGVYIPFSFFLYSTVTLFARFLGLSMSQPLSFAT